MLTPLTPLDNMLPLSSSKEKKKKLSPTLEQRKICLASSSRVFIRTCFIKKGQQEKGTEEKLFKEA